MSATEGDSGDDDLGLNEHHQSQLSRYVQFAQLQRDKRLRTVDAAFEDCMLSRLSEVTYTRGEVEELLTLLRGTVQHEVSAELVSAGHTALLLLRQVFIQAQKWHLRLDAHIEQLENKQESMSLRLGKLMLRNAHHRDLLPPTRHTISGRQTRELMDLVKTFEEDELAEKPRGEVCLAPLNDDKALNELPKLGDQKNKLIERIQSIEAQANALASEKEELNSEMVKLRSRLFESIHQILESLTCLLRSELKFLKTSKDTVSKEQLDQIREEASSVQRELETSLQQSVLAKTLLEDELDNTRHKLEAVHAQLQLAEQELDHKFQQTAAYRNIKKILKDKNSKIKDLRSKLSKYEKDDTAVEEE